MAGCLETGSHLCHGCVTGASRHSPGETPLPVPRPPLVPGRRPAYPPSRTATQPLPARLCGTRRAAYRLSASVSNLSGAVAFRRLSAGRTILERMIDRRPQASRILVAQLTGEAKHHASWRDLTGDEETVAVAALRELGGGRADLLAQVAGVLEVASEGELNEPLARQAAGLCRAAGADPDAIPGWVAEGRRRKVAARMPPFSSGVVGRRSGSGGWDRPGPAAAATSQMPTGITGPAATADCASAHGGHAVRTLHPHSGGPVTRSNPSRTKRPGRSSSGRSRTPGLTGKRLSQKSPASQGAPAVMFPQDGRGATAENAPLAAIEQSARTRGDHEPASGLPDLCTASPDGASTWLGWRGASAALGRAS